MQPSSIGPYSYGLALSNTMMADLAVPPCNPIPTSLSLNRIEDEHVPAVSSPLNPNATASQTRTREQREKKAVSIHGALIRMKLSILTSSYTDAEEEGAYRWRDSRICQKAQEIAQRPYLLSTHQICSQSSSLDRF